LKVHGLLLLDKPRGLSSNTALQKARRLLDADKAGHGGTLDPMADGLLPLMFGEACKLAESALEGDKAYEATVRLGQVTTTDDTEGEIVASAPVDFSDAQLQAALERFRGRIVQVPPTYSALKVAGKALYRYARDGNPLQAAPREVLVHELEVLARRDGPEPALEIRVACGKGTYIRSLARDIGAALGCGAHLSALRRTVVGRFRVASAVTLDALAAMSPDERRGQLVELEALVSDWPAVTLEEAEVARFRQGQSVRIGTGRLRGGNLAAKGEDAADERIAVFCEGRLAGLGRCSSVNQTGCALAPARVIVT
jgi:tRNA pseudouridine55 synthase